MNLKEVLNLQEKSNLLDLTIEEIQDRISAVTHEKYRARQIFQWVGKGVGDIDEMSNLSKVLREQLKSIFYIYRLKQEQKLVSKLDGTVKYLFGLVDGNVIESVLMRYRHGLTACISSQAGCRMGCRFCASTGAGFSRDLTPGEMLGQVLEVQRDAEARVGNIVIMGIGEPFDNYENVTKFLRIVNHPDGLNVGYRHISVSTCGLVPEIIRFSKEDMPVTLSISLHAPNDEIREKLMPVSKKYSIDKIIEACKIYTEATRRRITFEYALISGMNDSRNNALELARKIKGMLCHVNLIPVNSVKGTGYEKSGMQSTELFRNILEKYGIETTVRRGLGGDIEAACGQLRRRSIESYCEKRV